MTIDEQIDTAPRDGSPVLVSCDRLHLYPFKARHNGEAWVFHSPGHDVDGAPFDPQPTHWHPNGGAPLIVKTKPPLAGI